MAFTETEEQQVVSMRSVGLRQTSETSLRQSSYNLALRLKLNLKSYVRGELEIPGKARFRRLWGLAEALVSTARAG